MNEVRTIDKDLLRSASQYIFGVLIIAVTVVICGPLSNVQAYPVVSFILLFIVSILATFMDIGPVLVVSALSALAWDFFFIPPHNTFKIDKPEDILMFSMFFIIALLNGVLTTKVRNQEQKTREREEHTNALFQLTKELSKARGTDGVAEVAHAEIKKFFSLEVFFLLQVGENDLTLFPDQENGPGLSEEDFRAAGSVFKYSGNSGISVNGEASGRFTFFPLKGSKVNTGVAIIPLEKSFTGGVQIFWETFLSQIVNALEREYLSELAKKAGFLDESDRLYKTLFNSVSHEFRIPVATIMAASDTLMTSQGNSDFHRELSREIFTSSIRLNRLIENLLNISRIENGKVSLRLDWYDIHDLINKVQEDLAEELKNYILIVSVPESLDLVKIDFGLMEQVLFNLLCNSYEYSPVNSTISLTISVRKEKLIIEVNDQGPGFPAEATGKIFDKFYRINRAKTGGLGLGLSIVRGFVEAHHGWVKAINLPEGGASIQIELPMAIPEL